MIERATAVSTALVAMAGCASIFNGTTQTVGIQSTPSGAGVKVVDAAGNTVHSGTTPMQVALPRGAGYFRPGAYTVRYALEGFDHREEPLQGRLSAWYIGNIVFGGLIGMLVVDPLTGGMYTYPDTVATTLATRASATAASAPVPFSASGTATESGRPAAPVVGPSATAPVDANGQPAIGTASLDAERLPEARSCSPAPRAVLTAKGPGYETYTIACRNGDSLAIRCEFGNCRALR